MEKIQGEPPCHEVLPKHKRDAIEHEMDKRVAPHPFRAESEITKAKESHDDSRLSRGDRERKRILESILEKSMRPLR